MEKRWTAYFLAAAAASAGVIFAAAVGMYIIAAAGLIFLAWWTLYFCGLEYRRDEDILIVKSGVVFRRTRRVKTTEILWTKRAVLRVFGENTVYTSLHTAGGSIVIFGEFSTEGLSGF